MAIHLTQGIWPYRCIPRNVFQETYSKKLFRKMYSKNLFQNILILMNIFPGVRALSGSLGINIPGTPVQENCTDLCYK